MRLYAKVLPQFWTGETGKKIRQHGHQTLVVAAYLVSCPTASWLGLYYLPMPVLCHETASPFEGASEALRRLSEEGFAYYDEATEHVWLPEMARIQIGEALKLGDNNLKMIRKELVKVKNVPFYKDFLEKYAEAYHLQDLLSEEGPSKPLPRVSEAPSKPRTRAGAGTRTRSGTRAGAGTTLAAPSATATGTPTTDASNGHPIKELLTVFDEKFRQKFSAPHPPMGGAEAKLAQAMIKTYGLDKALIFVEGFFRMNSAWLQEAGYTFRVFNSQLGKLVVHGDNKWLASLSGKTRANMEAVAEAGRLLESLEKA